MSGYLVIGFVCVMSLTTIIYLQQYPFGDAGGSNGLIGGFQDYHADFAASTAAPVLFHSSLTLDTGAERTFKYKLPEDDKTSRNSRGLPEIQILVWDEGELLSQFIREKFKGKFDCGDLVCR
jgi:hypothetical protein